MKEKKWTSKDIPEIENKIVIVTGGNIGLGYESVKLLSEKGAEVILACRNKQKGEEAKRKIQALNRDAMVNVMKLDLANLASIREFSSEYKRKYNKLDILLNNAGVMMCPKNETYDGFELQFGTNHLGHFALTGLLFDLLQTTKNSRIVTVSSRAHYSGEIDFNDLMWNNRVYDKALAYAQSKIANLYFTYELQRRIQKSGLSVMSVAAHPGRSNTNLAQHLGSRTINFLIKNILMPIMTQSAQTGALAGIRAAVAPEVNGGEYYGPNGKSEKKGYPVIVESNALSHNIQIAERSWDESEKLTGIKFIV
ncbi:MAG: oxidoreductase [Carboxylicivirga sp.]|jgi:NAD(P)-dependent dehydrogenase (short-subunit alcohol dehydrogenase family)|nr:oxidoreductase [Carboxylicivirga sp.]